MRKYLEKLGFKYEDDRVETLEPIKTPEQLDLDKMVNFAGQMREISNQLDYCKSIRKTIMDEDTSVFHTYSGGYKVSKYQFEAMGVHVDELYAFIYKRSKEREVELTAKLKEFAEGCVKCEIAAQ